MSLFDYKRSQQIAKSDHPFYALIMAAVRQADSDNLAALERGFPETVAEFKARYNSPGGVLPGEPRETQP